ncbi:MAG: PEP/pyruvate-binding domain-containing protein [archaeon]
MQFTLNFSKISKNDANIAGGKGASLGEMTQAGIPVPEGFVILSDAFEKFIEEADLITEIDAAMDTVNTEEVHTSEEASETIKALILNAEMPKDIETEILVEFKKLGAEYVAVRSSATAEDSASAAWAGQLESYLNTTKSSLLENVKKCWASLFTPRAIFYRFEQKLHNQKISVAVVVQKMVASEESGIAFSVHPVTQDRNQLIIEAGLGLGEAIVSGQITPDSYVIDKQDWHIIDKNISEQSRGLFRVKGGGNEWRELGEEGNKQILTDKEIIELSKLIAKIENHYGFPVDVEWAMEKGKLYITQSRPITTLTSLEEEEPKKKDEVTYSETPFKESEQISYKEFIDKYKKDNWKKVGSWRVPRLMFDIFNSSQSRFYLKKYGIQDIPPIKYLSAGYDVYVAEKELEIIEKKVVGRIDSGDFSFIYNFNKNQEKFRKELEKEIGEISKKKNYNEKSVSNILEKVLTILVVFEILRDMSNYLEESILKRFDELKIKQITVPELLDKDEESDAFKLETEIARLREKGKFSSKDIDKVIEEYSYLNQYFLSGEGYTKQDILEQIKRADNEKRGFEKHNFKDKKLNELIKILNIFSVGRILNNEVTNKAVYNLKPVFKKIASANKISYEKLLSLPLDQFYKLLERKKLTLEDSCLGNDVAMISINNNYLLCKKDLDKLKKDYLDTILKETKDFTGTPTYKGVVKGNIKIVLGSHDFLKFKEGEILVCSMTDPNYVPLMKKAAAIITDMGGILCHAAIISRELKKPCIIGTNIATKVLKDGQEVEVDADKGIVKILNDQNPSSEIIEKILKEERITQQGSAYPVFFNAAVDSTDKMKDPLGYSYEKFMFKSEKDFGDMSYIKSDLERVGEIILNKLKKDEKYFQKTRIIYSNQFSKQYNKLKSKAKTDYSEKELLEVFKITFDLIGYGVGTGHVIEAFSLTQSHVLKHLLDKKIKDLKQLNEALNVLTMPEEESFNNRHDESLLKAFKSKDKNKQKKLLEKHLEKFEWIKSSYAGTDPLTIKELLEQKDSIKLLPKDHFIKIRVAKKQIIKKYNIDRKTQNLANLLSFCTLWQDERKENIMKAVCEHDKVLHKIAEKYKIPVKKLYYLMPREIESKKFLDKEFQKEIKNREEMFIWIMNPSLPNNIIIFSGDKAKEIYEKISDQEKIIESTTISGTCASTGQAIGEVSICKTLEDIKNFEQGKILVTGMTRPEYLPAMKRASAIVTDEGGMTCHAAIVSRELGIPCIIGTKVGTKILKDRDLVEVKANHAQVIILEKSQHRHDKKTTLLEFDKSLDYDRHQRDYSILGTTCVFKGLFNENKEFFGVGSSPCYITMRDDILYHYTSKEDGRKRSKSLIQRNTLEDFRKIKKQYDKKLTEFNKFYKDSYKNPEKAAVKLYKTFVDFTNVILSGYEVPMYYGEDIPKEINDIALEIRRAYEDVHKRSFIIEEKILTKLEKKYNTKKGSLKYLTIDEFEEFLKTKKIPDIEKRKKFCIIKYTSKGQEIFYKESLWDELNEKKENQEIKGVSAYKGKAIGRVRIIRKIEDAKKIEKGDILVTSMTDPRYVPAMKLAGGIVTDEGGITCHAAIVARELKKPTIIGTKIATEFLQEGKRVEVDADEGIVRSCHAAIVAEKLKKPTIVGTVNATDILGEGEVVEVDADIGVVKVLSKKKAK